ncbi:probable isocitrate dehydrogenase [NAD] subunit beta, mitochondrial [Nematostella vectensis]|uniref:probable isocitrate dehydrogenase [NAD] subunit beta, mitochondrial n=1 Tax=Nematostella vectensis TaxID=45351 RepID=UPI002076D64D|nr:probable isocitrate dehydrogenase [NAD] subunit beta, mitochondrial [Nematostella vectensis]
MAAVFWRGKMPVLNRISAQLARTIRAANKLQPNTPCSLRASLPRLRQLSTTTEESDNLTAPFGGRHTVTLIPGDGVGPELVNCVKQMFKVTGVPVDWDEVHISDVTYGSRYTLDDAVESLQRTGVGLKGALTTPSSLSSTDYLSLNQRMKTELDLFANVVHCRSLPGVKTRHDNIDIVIIREQTEGEYTSLEHESVPGVVEMLKIITRRKSQRIAKFAFDYATKHNRKKVTCVHKANIMKKADGLFLNTCADVAKLYPKIHFEGMIVDNTCMQLVAKPQQFDVMVLPNLYGSIVDNVGAGLVGGAGLVPGVSIGSHFAIFEPGARHTYAQMAGRNVANPTAMLLAGVDLLHHLNLGQFAVQIQKAVEKTIKDGKVLTMDMGGSASTTDFMQAVIGNLQLH